MFLVVALFCGCVVRQGTGEISDAGVSFADAVRDCRNLETDFNNCGVCGNQCDGDLADRCLVGDCSCGPRGTPCSETEGCRFGFCVSADLAGSVCEFDNQCSPGNVCIAAFCSPLIGVPEVCDGVDNNIDGFIDNFGGGPLSRWCYDDDISADVPLIPPCSVGSQICQFGTWSDCLGAISPHPESGLLNCNGMDDDCDACIDGSMVAGVCVPTQNFIYDIIFAFDISGSMGPTIEGVTTASAGFSALYSGDPNFRFGIVVFPSAGDWTTLILDLSDFATFQSVASGVTDNAYSGAEPSYDAIYELGIEELPVSWRRGSTRIIIMFTDEQFQSYRTPDITERTACAALEHGETLAVFTQPSFQRNIDQCATMFFDLGVDVPLIISQLETVIQDPCSRP